MRSLHTLTVATKKEERLPMEVLSASLRAIALRHGRATNFR